MRRARFPPCYGAAFTGYIPPRKRAVCRDGVIRSPLDADRRHDWPGTQVVSGHFSLKTMILKGFFNLEFAGGLRHYIAGNK